MLGNNEKIQDVNVGDLFALMVAELPWRALNGYINGNAQLLKQCTLGGQRIKPEQRKRLEKQIINEAQKGNYSEMTCNAVFAVWYPVHEQLHDRLEGYFKSDEYKQYRSERKLNEEDYVLPQEKFESFFSPNDLKAWTVLLVFSPLKFTREQADAILNCQVGSAELAEQVAKLEEQLSESSRKAAAAAAELAALREQQQRDAAEMQGLKKSLREQKAEADALNQKLQSSTAENKRLTTMVAASTADARKREDDVTERAARETARLQAEVQRMQGELNGWQNKYQSQLLDNRRIVEETEKASQKAASSDRERDAALAKLAHSQKFVDLLLSRIDWAKLGGQLKTNTAMRRNFNSLIKRLNYEEDLSLTIEGTLPEFWAKLSEREAALVAKIANSSTMEVAEGDMEGFWNSVSEEITEVLGTLEARLFMLSFIGELLFSVYAPDQLESPVIPSAKKKA